MPITISGDGTITGLAEGGLENAKIIDADIKDDTISEAKLDIHADPSGTDKYLAYTSNGMEWAAVAGGLDGVTTGSGNVTISDGDLIVGTAGHGIDFSANTQSAVSGVSMGSELLDWYEEGTFTPTVLDWGSQTAGNSTDGSENGGKYTRIGNTVFINLLAHAVGNSSSFANRAAFYIGGLPFTQDTSTFGTSFHVATDGVTTDSGHAAIHGVQQANSNQFRVYSADYDAPQTLFGPNLPNATIYVYATFHYRCT